MSGAKLLALIVIVGLPQLVRADFALPQMLEAGATNATLVEVHSSLRQQLKTFKPTPAVEFLDETTLLVSYRPQSYLVHPRSMAGVVSTNLIEEIGPSEDGFILRIQVQPLGLVNQAVTPQTIQKPYGLTDVDVTSIKGTDRQIYWSLTYGPNFWKGHVDELKETIRLFDYVITIGDGPSDEPGTISMICSNAPAVAVIHAWADHQGYAIEWQAPPTDHSRIYFVLTGVDPGSLMSNAIIGQTDYSVELTNRVMIIRKRNIRWEGVHPRPLSEVPLSPGERFWIQVLDNREDTERVILLVDDAGYVKVPLLGDLPVAGLTLNEAADLIESRYIKKGYYREMDLMFSRESP